LGGPDAAALGREDVTVTYTGLGGKLVVSTQWRTLSA
jgi:hypothetical protein